MQEEFYYIGLEKTKNCYGYMHRLSPIGEEFVAYSKTLPELPMLDIGSAYGVATIPCLLNGANIIAVDISQEHLSELKSRVPKKILPLLKLIKGHFPNQLRFKSEEISAILVSHVLPFLTKREIINGFKLFNHWLVKGGKLFIVSYTPYHKTIENFIPVYEERKKNNPLFAGEIIDKRQYSDNKLISQFVPNRLMLLDKETLIFLLSENGFEVEYLDYLGGIANGVPKPLCLNGKEWIGCIARKVKNNPKD